ncbi:hypothetical protein ACE1MK_01580 [Tenacibaculum maritimum]|uniref:hypothetical protein n=1 Tax=Tenacibaculum maritimum TaxID=107401 RepID=UPI0012E6D3D3|nr:hypothetical protein [Tenacibaculum maritimum]MCD9581000.1 hypothetical protein [Tenacibaculum maritimum]MCD9634724.1 hypothetical protein [Tenacibaculum maritimum]CAA0202948.1 Probable transmembrane hypothetical protein; putative anti ECF-type sigma factor [Tenacibaculum maritimum]CAA0228934.1 Probable transmembrane hypothetical protein; putative anti ECF-type sigma factor [Tenacibaculum maritimum]CAA0229797.1 Probable transmembrane hypothetical protein; putative anti ECF-type sigma factor
MDLLEGYKKAWDNQPKEVNTLSKADIYKMAHSKSSSIVKWIFIIGLLEFAILNSLYFIIDMEATYQKYNSLGLGKFVFYSQIITYLILFYFLARFYLNYKSISVIESTKTVMAKILKTRRTVKHYVLFNLIYGFILSGIVTISMIQTNIEELSSKKLSLFICLAIISTIILLVLIWGFYQLIYGFLLRKLTINYKELAKLEN